MDPDINDAKWENIKANEIFKAKLSLTNTSNVNAQIQAEFSNKEIFEITEGTNLSSLETSCTQEYILGPKKSCVFDIYVKPNGKVGEFIDELLINTKIENENKVSKIIISATIKGGGILNPSYGQEGFAYGFVEGATRISVKAGVLSHDDGWIIGGHVKFTEGTGDQEDFLLYKFDNKGNIFTSFGTNGFSVVDLGTAADKIWDLDLLSNGDIAAASYKLGTSNWKFITTIFNKDGVYLGNSAIIASNQRNFTLAVDPNDKIILAGRNELTQQILLRRVYTDFTIDTTFGSSGVVINPIGSSDYNFTLALGIQKISSDNYKIIGVGWIRSSTEANADLLIYRLNSDGTLDTTFGSQGCYRYDYVLTDTQPNSVNFLKNEQLEDVLILDNNDIVATGISLNSESKWISLILKLSSNGILDTTFGEQNGFSFLLVDNNKTYAKSITKQEDNKLLITGIVYPDAPDFSYCFVARYKADGKIDTEFGDSGILTIKSQEGNLECYEIRTHKDGTIVVAAQGIKDSKPAVISIGIIP